MKLNLDEERRVEVELGDGARITAKIIAPSELMALRRRHTRTKTRRGQQVEEVDDKEFSKDFWGRTIDSWQGLQDQDGKAIPCNTDTKYRMVNRYPEIAEKIDEAIEAAKAWTFDADERAEKNLQSSADGGPG